MNYTLNLLDNFPTHLLYERTTRSKGDIMKGRKDLVKDITETLREHVIKRITRSDCLLSATESEINCVGPWAVLAWAVLGRSLDGPWASLFLLGRYRVLCCWRCICLWCSDMLMYIYIFLYFVLFFTVLYLTKELL